GILDMVDHYEKVVRALPEPPIIMGHSLGGLYTQILLDRGYGAAGVAIDSVPAKGVFIMPLSQLRSLLPAIANPLNNDKSLPLTESQFRYAFGNAMTEEESRAAYERYAVPGPDHTLFQTALANLNPHAASTVNTDNDHRAPLLLIAGGEDHIIPPSVTKANLDLYKHSAARTEYKEFPGRGHFIAGQRGWEEVADYSLDWSLQAASSFAGSSMQV
ncbi:MAG: alpha/beta fold hydrolase, partial [Armatimonadota bacterium]